MSGSENIYKPSAHVDLDWYKRDAVVWQSAGKREEKKKNAERNCDKKLGHSPENQIQNMSPNATNISHG